MDLRAAPEAQQHVQGPRIAPGRGVTVLPPPPLSVTGRGDRSWGCPQKHPPTVHTLPAPHGKALGRRAGRAEHVCVVKQGI